jgi:hypothetical protein
MPKEDYFIYEAEAGIQHEGVGLHGDFLFMVTPPKTDGGDPEIKLSQIGNYTLEIDAEPVPPSLLLADLLDLWVVQAKARAIEEYREGHAQKYGLEDEE